MLARLRRYGRVVRPYLDGVEWFFGLSLLALEIGLTRTAAWRPPMLLASSAVVLVCFALRLGLRGLDDWRALLRPAPVAAVALSLLTLPVSPRLAAGLALLHDGWALVVAWRRRQQRSWHGRFLEGVGLRPAQTLVVSFVVLIAVGTLLLWLPASAATPHTHVPFVDAFFTAVSATCVTGLATVDTAVVWSTFGLGVILALIQLGGLGIMVIAAAMALAIGGRLGADEGAALSNVFDEGNVEELLVLIRTVIGATLLVEAAGAAVLLGHFLVLQVPPAQAVAWAVFHAVSAFCNAGFALFSDNLMGFAADPVVNGVLALLITLGGLGFSVMVALARWARSRGRSAIGLHARLVLVTSGVLLFVGALQFFVFEFDRSLASLGLGAKAMAAVFQSVSARTAGFNTVAMDALHPFTVVTLMALMFVGASPGSTGGGVKTTTLALVLLTARAALAERQEVEVFGRRLPQLQIMRALALVGGAALTGTLGFGALLVSETLPFDRLAFETVSALGTVGLSMNLTPSLSVPGRVVVALLMFCGRVGPLTAVAALATRRARHAAIILPEGKVLVG